MPVSGERLLRILGRILDYAGDADVRVGAEGTVDKGIER
jgi:hypothetical protein